MVQAKTMSRITNKIFSGATVLGASMVMLSMLASGCTEPRGELAGCTTDDQCKGVRVCSSVGRCVSPLALPDPADSGGPDTSPDAGPGQDDTGDVVPPRSDTGPDTSSPDTGTDTGADADNPPVCDTAPIARLAGSDAPRSADLGTSVSLDASPSSAVQGQIERYEWSVVEFPYGGDLGHLKPVLERRDAGQVSFVAATVGTYIIELTVVDGTGTESCTPARAEITVDPGVDILVEMVWNTPGDADQRDDDGSDMDLHYKHPNGDWGLAPLNIFWDNTTADWGEQNRERDDPRLLSEDPDGAGPEAVSHNRPEDLKYSVGVYYYDDYGFGKSEVTVRVYLDGVLAHEVSAESLPGADTFYEAVTIDAGNETVAVDDVHYDGYPPLD
jgi:hypothetical protein